jgi:tRNA (mo5U34)-methyltransferase
VTEALDASRLRHEVAGLEWYHTLELAPGVVTPGWFDLRTVAGRIPWPDLTGRRCLDVGTFDGFWAFEMERRGADEVQAVDLLDPMRWDWPAMPAADVIASVGKRKAAGRGFEIARDAFGSKVRRHEMSVYDLDPAELGTFDLVYLGSLLLHLRDPVRALERVRSVCGGELIVVDAIDLTLTALLPRRPTATLDGRGRPWWWKPNLAGLVRMVEAAGFEVIGKPKRLFMPAGAGQPLPPVRPRLFTSRAGREAAVLSWRGDPHAAVRARPRLP